MLRNSSKKNFSMFIFLDKIRSIETLDLNHKYFYIFEKRTKLLVKFFTISLKIIIFSAQIFMALAVVYLAVFKFRGLKFFLLILWLIFLKYVPRTFSSIVISFVAFICLTTIYLQLRFRQNYDEMKLYKRGKGNIINRDLGNFSNISFVYKTVCNS